MPNPYGQAAGYVGGVQYDAQGRPYVINPQTGAKSYISPASYATTPAGVDAATPHGGGFFSTRPTWNQDTGQFESGFNWGNLLSLVVAGVITAGVADAIMSGTPVAEAVTAAGGDSQAVDAVTTAVATDTGAAAGPAAAAPAAAATTPGYIGAGVSSTAEGASGLGAEGIAEGGGLPTAGVAATGAGATEGATLAATAAGASTPSWLNPLIGAGIGAAGQLVGAGISSSAITDAAKIQADTAAKALAYLKQEDAYRYSTEANRYGAQFAQRAPYVATGQSANAAAAAFLGLPAPPPQAPIQPPPSYQAPPPPGYQPPVPQGTAAPRPGTSAAPLVTMRAPDGTVKQIPADQEQHYTQLGAVRVS